MKLRPYQERAITDLRAAYSSGKRAPVLVLPTGAGKTVVAAAIVQSAVARGNRVLFLVHRQELLAQSVAKLDAAGIHSLRIIQAGSDLGSPSAPVVVASIPTLTRWRDRQPDAQLVIIDEAHHVVAKTWNKLTDHYRAASLLGLTATPQRADGRSLGDVFDSIVVGSTVKELTDHRHLVTCHVYGPSLELGSKTLALSPVDAYRKHGDGQRGVVFCASVKHADAVAAEMNAAGIRTGVVHGGLTADARRRTLVDLDAGRIDVVASCHVLTEGWDLPSVAVCILARFPKHVGLFLQMVGRVLRPSPDKDHAVLIDLCGSVHLHGPPDMEREFTLDGKGIGKVDRDAIRQCLSCGGVFRVGPAACPLCGVSMPARPLALPTSSGVGVVNLTGAAPASRTSVTIAITSKYPGVCKACKKPYRAGERIYWTKGEKRQRHASCASAAALAEANRVMSEAM